MTKEEIKPGDHVWVSIVRFSNQGNMTLGLLAELEKRVEDGYFNVVKVEKGTSLKVGRSVFVGYYFGYSDLYKTRKDALESWNQVVYNNIDRLTSTYEKTIKRIKEKIL